MCGAEYTLLIDGGLSRLDWMTSNRLDAAVSTFSTSLMGTFQTFCACVWE
jgi:hypothetical protein